MNEKLEALVEANSRIRELVDELGLCFETVSCDVIEIS